MDLQLTGKTAFISGSTSGIGFGVAKLLVKEGAHVVLNGRTEKKLQTAIDQLKVDYPSAKVSGIAADFSKVEEVNHLLNSIGEIDILINNVGIYTSQSFFETADEDWFKQFDVNVMSGVRLSRVLLPQMIQRNWGRVIFISSECASLVPPDMIAYSMTKAAVHSITSGLAQLTKGTSVTVNVVMPGSTLTPGAEDFLESVAIENQKTKEQVAAEFFKDVRTSSLLQRFAHVDEVAHLICYVASPLSSATNGSVLKVDGGSTC